MNLDHATDLATVEADLVSWMAVHGQLLLALRHPQNIGASAQLVSDFCEKIGWGKTYPGPELPEDVVAGTRRRYVEAFEQLTALPFEKYLADPSVVLA